MALPLFKPTERNSVSARLLSCAGPLPVGLSRDSGTSTVYHYYTDLIKDGEKGPVVWEAKAAPFYIKDKEGLPTRAHVLIVARHVQCPGEVKYLVSNAAVNTPLTTLLAVAFARGHVERCFQDMKTELGMNHFEVRNYTSLRRHLTLSAVSLLFLSETHATFKKNAGVDALPGPNGGQCLPAHPKPAARRASPAA